jgi:hypothetical protein
MTDYYTDSAKKSLWVLSAKETIFHNKEKFYDHILTCFAAKDSSGYYVGQQVSNPKLENSNWKSLGGEVKVEDVLIYD